MTNFHRQSGSIVDRDELDDLDFIVATARDSASKESTLLAAQFCLYAGDMTRAREMSHFIESRGSSPGDFQPTRLNVDVEVLRAWIEISSQDGRDLKGLKRCSAFERLKSAGGSDISLEGLMAMAK